MKPIYIFLCTLFAVIGCCKKPLATESNAVQQEEPFRTEATMEELMSDSFTVIYRNAINDYRVKAVLKVNNESDCPVLSADLYFTKNGQTFMLHSSSFGDTLYNHGRYDPEEYNLATFKKYRGKTVQSTYTVKEESNETMLNDVPFFFKDVDFDDIPELVIVHKGAAIRYHDGYDIYRIIDDKPFLIDYPPYNQNRTDWGFGMTDYPKFDYINKTITCPYPEGEISYTGYITYGIAQKEKDVIKVNGKKHYFNKIIKVKEMQKRL